MAMPDSKDICCNPNKLSHDALFLGLKLSCRLVLTGWRAHPNCDIILNCAGSPKRFLRRKLQDGKCIPLSELVKYHYASFIGTDGVLLEVRNQNEEYCTWSLIATTSRILALSLQLL
jgi:hypothetical protein